MSEETIPVFGIYFGNSSCCLSVYKKGNIDIIANASGDRVTPVLVGFQDKDIVVGTAAKQGLIRHENCSVTGALRVVSSPLDDVVFPLNLKCQLNNSSRKPKFILQGEETSEVPVTDIFKHLFTFLREIGGIHSNSDELPVVITLPSWANEALSSVHSTASSCGFQVIKIVSQPAAACLAYDLLEDNTERMNVLILHCGGTTTVTSVAELSGGFLNVKETICSHAASGDAVTNLLVQHLAKEFHMKYKGDPLENRRSKRKLFMAAEECKRVLSTRESSQVHIDSLWEGVDFSTQLSRARFEGIVNSFLTDLLSSVKEVLQRAELSHDQIKKVILTGGSCKIPKLQNMISDQFPSVPLMTKLAADEVLALGAAKEAAFYKPTKTKAKRSAPTGNSILSCLSLPVYAKIIGENKSQCLFPSGASTHHQQTISFEGLAGPSSLVIYEADEPSESPLEKQILTQIELNFPSTSAVSVQLTSIIKGDGSLLMKVQETKSKLSETFLIKPECS